MRLQRRLRLKKDQNYKLLKARDKGPQHTCQNCYFNTFRCQSSRLKRYFKLKFLHFATICNSLPADKALALYLQCLLHYYWNSVMVYLIIKIPMKLESWTVVVSGDMLIIMVVTALWCSPLKTKQWKWHPNWKTSNASKALRSCAFNQYVYVICD